MRSTSESRNARNAKLIDEEGDKIDINEDGSMPVAPVNTSESRINPSTEDKQDVINTSINTNYKTEVALGNISNHTLIELSAENRLINSVFETIWSVGGRITKPTTDSVLTLSSTSIEDSLTGTGANTVTVNGLDINYLFQTETVDMDGQNNVNTTKKFIFPNECVVASSGSNNGAVGTISIKHGSDIVSAIEPKREISRQGCFLVPANQVLVINEVLFSTGRLSEGVGALYITNFLNGIEFYSSGQYFSSGNPYVNLYKKINEKEYVEFVARNSSGAGDIRVEFLSLGILRSI